MKAIDLHIHSVKTVFDADFTYDINKLQEYVVTEKLSCIAITNHNLFDRNNYECISNTLNIPVLPGIEVSLEKGHMLVIGNVEDVDNMEKQSNMMRQYIFDEHSYITYESSL